MPRPTVLISPPSTRRVPCGSAKEVHLWPEQHGVEVLLHLLCYYFDLIIYLNSIKEFDSDPCVLSTWWDNILQGFFSWHFPELLRSLCMWEQMLPPPSPLVKFFCFLCLKIAIARSNSKPDNVFGANSGATFLLDICTSNRATCRIVEQPGCCPLTLTYCWLCDTHTLTPLLGEVVWSYWCRSNLVFTLQRYVIIFDNAARAIIAPDEWILRSVN